VKISLDDFGTGYSSLAYLKKLPLDSIKIDQSFVKDVSSDEHDAVIVSMIVAMAEQLNLDVVAEGVENEDIFRFLRARNCARYQGYLFYRPMDEKAYFELIGHVDEAAV